MTEYLTNDNGNNRPMTPAETAAYTASLPSLEAQDAAHAEAEAATLAARNENLQKRATTNSRPNPKRRGASPR
jgi:hypothetical protein